MSAPEQIAVSGGFDDIRSRDLRFLQEAARLGELNVLLWSDKFIEIQTGKAPKFSLPERLYFLNAVRYVTRVIPQGDFHTADQLPPGLRADVWADIETTTNSMREEFCRQQWMRYRILKASDVGGFPEHPPPAVSKNRKKVVVTGSYDWFHSGHVRFFEEVSEYGDLFVVVGHDANIRLLKGEGHPFLPQDERRYVVGAIRCVAQALISTGEGWLDADPEIRKLKPHIYAVNEDGDKGGKREYCEKMGIEYHVFKRTPAPGLPTRTSTDLRGF